MSTYFDDVKGSRLADISQDKIKDLSNVFIFPFKVHTGIQNQTNAGNTDQNASPNNYVEFKQIWTGKAMVIAQWEKAIDIRTRKQLSSYDLWDFKHMRNVVGIDEALDDPFIYEWDTETVNNSFSDGKSYIIFLTNLNGDIRRINQLKKKTRLRLLKTKDELKIDNKEMREEYFYWNESTQKFGDFSLDDVLELLENGSITNIFRNDYITITDNYENVLFKQFTKGEFFKGQFVDSNAGIEFNEAPSDDLLGDFVQSSATRTITIRTVKKITKDDLFKFYWIPQYFEAEPTGLSDEVQWLYISNSKELQAPNGEFIGTEITFSSVNDSIAKTGQSINQYIQYSSLGEGACLPSLIYNDSGIPTDFKINPLMINDNGINTVQINSYGVSAITAPIVVGRPIINVGEFNQKILPSRDLLMADYKYPIPDNLNKQSSASTDFLLMALIPELETYYANYMEAVKATYTDSLKKEYDGYIETNYTNVIASNPDNLTLRDIDLIFKNKDVTRTEYNTLHNPAFRHNKNKKTIGIDTLIPANMERLRNFDVMNLARYLFSQIVTLPMVSKEQIAWNIRDLPILGGLLNTITFGLPIGFRQESKRTDLQFPNFQNTLAFIDSGVYSWYSNAFWPFNDSQTATSWLIRRQSENGRIPLGAFKNNEESKIGGIIGSSAKLTSVTFRLTDKVYLNSINVETEMLNNGATLCSTIMLGQKDFTDQNKAYIYGLNSMSTTPENSDEIVTDYPVQQNTAIPQNYIIDAIGLMSIYQGDIRISAYDRDPDEVDYKTHTVFETTIQSEASWTGDIRAWLTLYKTSYLDDFINDGSVLAFPQPLPVPRPLETFQDQYVDLSYISVSNSTTVTATSTSQSRISEINNTYERVLFDFSEIEIVTTAELYRYFETLDFSFKIGNSGQNKYSGTTAGQPTYTLSETVTIEKFFISSLLADGTKVTVYDNSVGAKNDVFARGIVKLWLDTTSGVKLMAEYQEYAKAQARAYVVGYNPGTTIYPTSKATSSFAVTNFLVLRARQFTSTSGLKKFKTENKSWVKENNQWVVNTKKNK